MVFFLKKRYQSYVVRYSFPKSGGPMKTKKKSRPSLLLSLLISLSAVSCIRPPEKRLDPSLQGTIIPVSDLLKLECVLTTGAPKREQVNWSTAEEIKLERKSPRGQYEKLNFDETVLYDYKNPVRSRENDGTAEKKTSQGTGYINYFPYVSIDRIQSSDKRSARTSSENYKTLTNKRIVKTNTDLTCNNLLQPEDIPFLTAKPHHDYLVRFQVVGDAVRALLLAPAEDLPSQSLPYSFNISNRGDQEIYAMPIGGYAVEQGYIEQQENTDWEATNVLVFRKIPIRKRAEYQTENRGGIVSSLLKYHQKGETSSQLVRQVRLSSRFQAFKTLAERGGKKNIFPKSFLAGDWYHASTVIVQSVSSHTLTGIQLSMDNHYWNSNKIRFRFGNGSLVAYTLNRETTKETLSAGADRWVFKIPIKHLDYRTDSPLGEIDAGLEEIIDNTKNDQDKNYVQIHFDEIQLGGWNPDRKYQLHKVTLSKDYFDFVLRGETAGHQLRFSFLRPLPEEERTYIPLTLTRGFEKFPTFLHRRRVSYKEKLIRSRAFQSAVHIQRFDPVKPIVYRFSTLTPNTPWIRNLGREIISVWQQIFEKAGVTCGEGPCITLLDKPEHDAELGDIRYNILNLISPDDFVRFHSINGFGPSISDFETGEVISATSHLYLDQMHTRILRDIYHYIKSYSGLTLPFNDRIDVRTMNAPPDAKGEKRFFYERNKGNILIPRFLYSWNPEERRYDSGFGPMEMDQVPFSGLTLSGTKNGGKTIELFSENSFSVKNKKNGMFSSDRPETSFAGAPLNGPHCSLLSQEEFLPSRLNYHLIDALCGEKLTLLKEIQNHSSITEQSPHIKRHWLWTKSAEEQNRSELFSCADKVLKVSALGTGLHELGHNISLRHNFAASADKNNFLPADGFHYNHTFENEGEKQKILSLLPSEGVTASVMDYMPSSAERIVPGRYDTAFIRFLYKGEVETGDGAFAKAEITEEGELRYVSEEGNIIHPRNLRDYKVCTDGDIENSADIYCDTFDRGTTPSEIVQNHYTDLIDGLSLDGSALSPHIFAMGFHLQLFFQKTIKIYHKWRVQLSKALSEGNTLTLRNFGAKDYKEKLANLICKEETAPAEDEKNGAGVCTGMTTIKNPELAELYKARTIIHNTLRKMLFTSLDHYCVLRNMNKNDLEEWVPFSDIHRHLSETSRPDLKVNYKEISSCNDVKKLFPRNVKKYIGEIGIPLFPGVFSLRQNRDFDFYQILDGTQADYSGSIGARLLAGIFLISHSRSPVLGQRNALSLMNEPDLREDIFQLLTDRILNGIPIGTIEGTNLTAFQPVFSNEEILWRFLSLPLFISHGHPTTTLDRIENTTDSLAVIRSVQFSHPNTINPKQRSLVQKERVLAYDDIRRAGGYLVNENKELYHRYSDHSALFLINKTQSPHLTSLINAIRAVDLRQSFLKFTEKMNQSDRDTFFENKKVKMLSYVENLVNSAKKLYNNPSPFVGVLTFSLLYDFLEIGEPDEEYSHLNNGALTDHLVQQLQLGRILHFRVEEAFQKKCAETNRNTCPEPYLTPQKNTLEEFDKLVKNILNTKDRPLSAFIDTASFQKRRIKTTNIFKPFLEELAQYIYSTFPATGDSLTEAPETPVDYFTRSVTRNPYRYELRHGSETPADSFTRSITETKRKIFDLVQDLYLMELFRSDHHTKSEVRHSLEFLFQYLKTNFIPTEEQAKVTKRIEEVALDIALLRTLRNYPNSKFFQEIFIRNTMFYSLIQKTDSLAVSAVTAMLNFILHPLGPTVPSTASDMLTFIDIENNREKAVFQNMLQRSRLVSTMYQSVFLDENVREVMQEFQELAPDILTKAFAEAMNTVRTIPPLLNNPVSGMEHFFSAAYYDESAPLYDIFNGRVFKELSSQKNIILSAINPYLILGNEDGKADLN